MPKLQLPESLCERLCQLPETGMGYHLVDLLLSDGGRIKHRIVLNSEHLVVLQNEKLGEIVDFRVCKKKSNNSKYT